MERHFVRLTLVNFVFFYALQFGGAQHNYKLFPGKVGGGLKLRVFSNIASAEDCFACCTHTDTCLSASFNMNGPGSCFLFSSINTFMYGRTDHTFIHAEIDVAKGNYGCNSEREINTDRVKCICDRNASGIYCETINSCPVSRGYKIKRQSCFKYVAVKKSQRNASAACQREGGHLFTLESPDDLYMLLTEASSNEVPSSAISWIDGGEFKQAWDGGPLPWESWFPGSGNPSCVSLCHRDRVMEGWACAKREWYFCQIDY